MYYLITCKPPNSKILKITFESVFFHCLWFILLYSYTSTLCPVFFFFFSSAAITTNFPAEIIKVSSFFFKPQNKQKLPEEDTWLDPVQHRAGFVLHQHNSIPPLLQIHVNEALRACVCVCVCVQVCVFTFYIRLVSKHIRASLLPPCLLCLMSTPPPLLSVFVPVIFLSHQSPKQTPTSI